MCEQNNPHAYVEQPPWWLHLLSLPVTLLKAQQLIATPDQVGDCLFKSGMQPMQHNAITKVCWHMLIHSVSYFWQPQPLKAQAEPCTMRHIRWPLLSPVSLHVQHISELAPWIWKLFMYVLYIVYAQALFFSEPSLHHRVRNVGLVLHMASHSSSSLLLHNNLPSKLRSHGYEALVAS